MPTKLHVKYSIHHVDTSQETQRQSASELCNVLILEAAIEIPRHSKLILAADKKKITDSKLILAIEITLFWLGAFVDRPTAAKEKTTRTVVWHT